MSHEILILISCTPQREPLFEAAKKGHVKATLLLLRANEECCKQTNNKGQNCLMIAITGRHR